MPTYAQPGITGSITAADVASATASGMLGQSLVTGTPTTNSAVTFTSMLMGDYSSFNLQILGTWVATLVVEKSFDGGVTWITSGAHANGSPVPVFSITSNGMLHGNLAGLTHVRVRCTSYTSGTVNITITPGGGIGNLLNGAVTAGGYSTIVSATFTRPNDGNVYAAGDQVANSTTAPVAMTFSGCSRTELGSGLITSLWLMDQTNQSTLGNFELWLFNSIPTLANDNAAAAYSIADGSTLLPGGVVTLSSGIIGNTASDTTGLVIFQASGLSIPFRCTTTTNLYGAIVVRNAYTPIANEVFLVRLGIIQD